VQPFDVRAFVALCATTLALIFVDEVAELNIFKVESSLLKNTLFSQATGLNTGMQ